MNLAVLCTHCREPYGKHLGKKCLYGPATFKQHRCRHCNKPVRSHSQARQNGELVHLHCVMNFYGTVTGRLSSR